ncbi:uncharacterized protein J4E78_009959 [Alternaria triticimaculans]|uniref:uncharacterized protein n=1 Tax=Alternaria triticimaculans TaxID=297637 RepID=UPI0020C524B6|nr:uncharacterized protein J4E78_009959 [Alternaria triticimaculans]KAI4643233.1 hypothetical protein J4E78_009959 [Alternaria triticimaculans]
MVTFDVDADEIRYHSRRPLSAVVRNHLRHYQTKIQDLRIGLYTDPGSPDVLPQILCGLQRLDLYVDNSTSLILLYMNIEAVGANLKSLSLTAANSMDISTELDAWAMGEENEYTQCTPKLEEFTLSNFIYDNAYEQFSIIVNYHQLVRLGLFGNSGGTHYFLQELAESSEENKLRLKHIAVEIAGDIAESTELVPLRLSLNQIYKACEPLESFHIHYPHGDHSSDFDVYDFLKPFTDRGHNLQSLSYHVEQWNWGQLNHDVIDVLYRLAVYFEEALMLDGLWNEEARFMIFMTWIGYFREVRLLHLRVPHCVRMGQSKHGWDPALLILQLQTFANRVFEFLGPESKLDALVIGHVATLRNPENLDLVRPLPQQCFLRGEQRDILGRTVPVAVPVTRMMLRETQPYTDILEVDYRTAADEWEAWATRTM